MNQKLQDIFSIIQQSEKLSADQKNKLLKAVKDADKELEITAFKLERTEKVKKTTAILLEETIEELEQKRKAVEEQNRELEIEASLERVRTVAMSMNKSEDLLSICEIFFKESKKLGFNNLRNSLINIFNDEEESFVNYDYSDYMGGSISNVSYKSNPANDEFLIQIRKANDAFVETVIDRNQLDEWKEFRRSHGEQDDPRLDNINALYYYNYSIGSGSIGISNFKPATEKQLQILKRFRNVFDLAYRRYNDISQAEAQAREAQIEMALERVRSRTMAMQKSDELAETAYMLYEQFGLLGENPEQLTIGIIDETHKIWEFWLTLGGNQINHVFKASIDEPIVLNKSYIAWKERKKSIVIDISSDELKAYYNFFKNLPGYKEFNDFKNNQTPEHRRVINMAFFSNGSLSLSSPEPKPAETIQLLERFASVLEQTYTRFLDLQKAEAQAREAQIELALERVRARTMAMHNSQDVGDTVVTLFDEVLKLGLDKSIRCGIGILEGSEHMETWSATSYPNGEVDLKMGMLDMTIHPMLIGLKKAWKNGEQGYSYDYIGDDVFRYYSALNKEPDYPFQVDLGSLPENEYHKSFFFTEGILFAFAPNPISEEASRVLDRFARVFGQTYRRYLDLQKAEAQAREAQIEASLEKVRAVAMSMNKSDDLLSICDVSFKEFKKLGFENIRNALIHIQYDEQKYFMDYDFSDLTGGAITKIEYGSHPVVEDYLQQINSAEDAFYQGVIKEDQLEEWKSFRRNSGQIDDPRLEKATALHYYFFSIGVGDIGISTLQPIDESQIKILKRFRNVFDLAYRRYNDIAFAETQAREAEIEAALERVRSRTMAMQKSDELAETASHFFEQLNSLGIKANRFNIAIVDSNSEKCQLWSTTNEGKVIPSGPLIPLKEHKVFNHIYDGWIQQDGVSVIRVQGEDRITWTKYIMNYVSFDEYKPENIDLEKLRHEPAIFSNFFFKQGFIVVHTIEEIDEADIKIIQRFVHVFEQTYTRFLDLQKAEVQAREAIKQAALDRIRGEIASMRTSEDLNHITPIIWRELKNLEVPFFRCGVFIVDERNENVQVYLTTPDGKSLGVLNLPFDTNDLTNNTVEYWQTKKVYKEHWNKKEFINWTKLMMKMGQVENEVTYQGSAEPPESLDLHFVPFSQGMLYVGDTTPLSDEKLQLVKTLAEAFSIAYARYEDFKNLEEAKNKIEITLNELKAAQAQLIHSEKMASLGELTAGIAHEIKNPLNFVNNFSEVSCELLDEMQIEIKNNNIEDVIDLVEDLKQNLDKINQHGKRADSIVKGMLLHSRGTSGEKTPTDINDLLDQYVNLAYHGMRATNKEFNITIEKDYDKSIEKINVVPQDLSRVFLNIINNACYAAFDKKKKGGNNFSPTLRVSTKKINDRIEIKIGDNGNGIPADHLDKIFQPFFTTKPSGEGTGLGLSLSYDIVTKVHGGDLKVETKDGEGTEFLILLPSQ